MPSLLARAARVAGRVSPYAVVPFALSLAAVRKVASAGGTGFSMNVRFALPADVATVWTLVDPPTQGVTLQTPVPLVALPVFLVVEAAVVAGFLGGVRDAYRGQPRDFLGAASDYWLSILGVRLVQFVVVVVLGGLLLAAGPMSLVFGLPLVLLFGYLVWGAPYLVVLRDSDAITALAESATVARAGGDYLLFSLGYAVAVAAGSVVVSPFVSAGGLGGVLLAAALVAYPALVASAAATIVVDECADRVASRGA